MAFKLDFVLKGDGNEPDDDSDGIYDEISPYVPPRKPIGKTAGATAQTAAPKAKKKGIFKKWGGKKQQKNKEEVDNANRDTTSKTTTKTVNVDDRKPIPVPVKPIGDSDIYYGECEVNNSYEELEEHNVETGNLTYTPLEAKKSSECTIAPSDVFAEKMSMPLNMSHLKRNDPLQTKSLSGKGTSNEETFKKPEASIIHGRGSVQNKYVRMAYGSGKVEPIKKMEKALNKPPYDNTKFHDGRGGTDTDGQGKAQTGPSNQPSEPLSVHETQSAAGNRLSVADMTMHELGSSLQKLKLDKYVAILEEQMIDGSLLKELSIEDFVNELGLTKVEAIRLNKFANTGHIPR